MRKPSSPRQEDNSKPNFLRRHKDEISGIGAIATAIAVILATIGLFLAYSQLNEVKKTIEQSKSAIDLAAKSLEASTIYTIQKDGRELFRSLQKDVPVFHYIYKFDKNKEYDDDLLLRADLKITEIIQYFSSVLNQRRNKVISDTYWDTFANEICWFVKKLPVSQFWKKKVIEGKYSNDFKRFGNECLNTEN